MQTGLFRNIHLLCGMPSITIIFPILNEVSNEMLYKSLNQLKAYNILIADGGSSDGTIDKIKKFPNVTILENSGKTRAMRINNAIKNTNSDYVFINHPRSIIDPKAIDYIITNKDDLLWGGLFHEFDHSHPLLKLTSWYSNFVRARLRSIIYLDHCIFAKRSLMDEIGPIKDVDIFEDTLLSLMLLKKAGRAKVLSFKSTTSAIRFQKRGFYKQSFMNQYMKLCFFFKVSPKKMNKLYEKDLELNSKYNDPS